jgi:hypothetical protein
MLDFKFNETKAIAVVLYVVKSIVNSNSKMAKPDFHKVSKVKKIILILEWAERLLFLKS